MAYRTLHELVEMLIDTCREDPFIEVYVQMIPKGGDVDDFLEEVVLTITDRTWADITKLPHYQMYKDWIVSGCDIMACDFRFKINIQPNIDEEYCYV